MFLILLLATTKYLSLSVSTHMKRNYAVLFHVVKLTQVVLHMTLIKLFLIFLHILNRRRKQKRFLGKWHRLYVPPKKIDCPEFLTQFEFLYKDTIMFEMEYQNRDFLKNKLKDICFSTLKLYRFKKVEKIYQKLSL